MFWARIATFGLPEKATLPDWMRAADGANKLGERTRKSGIQLGFHNHDFEFQKLDGQADLRQADG